MKNAAQFRRLEDRLTPFGDDVGTVVRKVLFEEQRKLALKNPKDIVIQIQRIIDDVVGDGDSDEARP